MIDDNDSHPWNASAPIDVTEDGMFIDLRFLQLRKEDLPIEVIFDVIFTVSKLIHSSNAYCSMVLTPSSISIDSTSSANSDHGVYELLQHDIVPVPEIVRIEDSSLNTHTRFSPQVPEVTPRGFSLSSPQPFLTRVPSDLGSLMNS